LAVFVAQTVFSYFRVYLFVDVTEKLLEEIRKATYANLIKLNMSFITQRRAGELSSRISADISQIQDTFTTNIAEFLRQFIIIIGGIILLFMTSGKLALAMLLIIPPLAVLTVIFGYFVRKKSKGVQDLVAESNTIVDETLQGIHNVKAFANEYFEILRYGTATGKVREKAVQVGRLRAAFASFIIFGLFGGIVFLIFYGAYLKQEGLLEYGDLVQFMLYTLFVGGSIGGIAEQYNQIQKTLGATDRVLELLNEPAEEVDNEGVSRQKYPRFQGDFAFENVAFAYPSRKETPVLQGVSFAAKAGDKIALVGQSGSGKTTISSLLLRFYEPDSGLITVDGKDIREYPLTHLRSQMAIVPQDVVLFGGSIRENIRYGKPEASEEEIIEAAKMANAWNFISQFPEGLDAVVGDRGIKLSGGQRQRIAIARAILKNPSILILDEATSSLDSESEALVQEALEKLMKGRTSLVIAHRLSTIRNSDCIVVLQNGSIIESGTHESLISNEEGIYRKLNAMQSDWLSSPKFEG
ncbi:MAG: ATP-binding cassette domain-containing protein, partial [Bacteroidota bacterium]|nr:ATP-binding cassette domain-containing protein [Bacteroidota bacterium]MDX5430040.1 ATP-binding cassette domain-containing protein [Bacteroidota bacterium]MDX5468810.1 ATP-binding cassette domain-containing protein [Bacteroidota bacterium]